MHQTIFAQEDFQILESLISRYLSLVERYFPELQNKVKTHLLTHIVSKFLISIFVAFFPPPLSLSLSVAYTLVCKVKTVPTHYMIMNWIALGNQILKSLFSQTKSSDMDLLLLFLRMSLKKDMELLEQSFSIRKINLPEVETQLLFLEKVILFSISSWEDSFRQMAFGILQEYMYM